MTVGDFLRVCRQPGFDPAKTAFMMPTAHGPCRFGQYAPYLRQLMDEMGYHDVVVFSPSSDDGYEGYDDPQGSMSRNLWMGVIAGDLALKFLLKTRPYETHAGDSDEVFHETIADFDRILSQPGITLRKRRAEVAAGVERMRDRYRAVPARYEKGRPLIGLVGEIFCRQNTFSNDDVARRVEKFGGECWLSDITEWIWYVNAYVEDNIVQSKGRFNLDMLKLKLKTSVQHRYEHAMLAPLKEDFRGYEEPHDVREVLAASEPYLPTRGCVGEMVLSVGKAIYLSRKGADGILDISPFTCMNGIISEGVYPAVSEANDGLPIRICYFDGMNTSIDRDIEIFLDLARAYQARKSTQRIYPPCFGSS